METIVPWGRKVRTTKVGVISCLGRVNSTLRTRFARETQQESWNGSLKVVVDGECQVW